MDLSGKSDQVIAALAVKERSTDWVQRGLDGLFTSTATEDFRDVISALVLYNDALNRVGVDADSFCRLPLFSVQS